MRKFVHVQSSFRIKTSMHFRVVKQFKYLLNLAIITYKDIHKSSFPQHSNLLLRAVSSNYAVCPRLPAPSARQQTSHHLSSPVHCSGNNSQMHNLRYFQSQCWQWHSAVLCSVQWFCTCIFGRDSVLWWCCPKEFLVRNFYLSLEMGWSLVLTPKVSCIYYYVLL
jgi:hypothetical protein